MDGRERIEAVKMLKFLEKTGAFYEKTRKNLEEQLMRLEIEALSLKANIRRERLKNNEFNPEDHSANAKDILNLEPDSLDPDCVVEQETIMLELGGPVLENNSECVDVKKSSKCNKKQNEPNASKVPKGRTRKSSRQLNKPSNSKAGSSKSSCQLDKPSTSKAGSSSHEFDQQSTPAAKVNNNSCGLQEYESSQSCSSVNQNAVVSNITDDRYLDHLYLDPSTYGDPSFMEFDV